MASQSEEETRPTVRAGCLASGTPVEIKLVRHYDPVKRDKMVSMYKSEAHEIDSALEVVNAVTDLIEEGT